ncbi:calcium-binding protein [Caulobacter sp. SL161]|uniref:calcium-binding protein n=1 Tax=Caulobacter sp. SL161 TaxID=2995156 RepID=UPI00227433A1|nr:calcium-binding protein [Caulobacter sp. SL161]MCY1648606.1 calcium-binding protein [Caulobacter sp. SL161]
MNLNGTQGADTLIGGAEDDVIYGFWGNDTLRGGAGHDVLAGHEGNDVLQGGDGDDYMLGGPGNDTLDGGAGSDWAAYEDATAGVKVDLNLNGGQNTGGGGTDRLTGIENLYGSAFNDTLVGNAGDNVLMGWDGNDIISGGKGEDTLWGSAGNDTLDGGDNDDWLVGGAGDDVIKGGAGADWSSYEDATAGVTVDLTKTTAQDTIGAGKDTLSGIESVWGSKFADVLTGDAGSNYLFADAGDDKLYGGAGDDFFAGGAGVNVIDGGEGFDTVDYAMSDVGVEVDLSRNFATSRFGDTSIRDTLSSIELVTGSLHADFIIGNMSENYLYGDAGNDVLRAEGGQDVLEGGEGDDFLIGSYTGAGDILIGGMGNDQLSVSSGSNYVDGGDGVDTLQTFTYLDVTVDLNFVTAQEIATGFKVELRGIENLIGGHGNDVLIGNDGDNRIEGLTGNDVIDGGEGFDFATYRSAPGGVVVDLTKVGVAQNTGSAGIDTLISIEGLRGSVSADILIGNAGANALEGEYGDDLMIGGGGRDLLTGGASADTFRFAVGDSVALDNTDGNLDVITDFESIDRLDFSAGTTPATYREMAASSYLEAQALAVSGVWSGANMKYYTAVQVGADVYVFVAGTTANSAGSENAIKLLGVSLSSIDATNFI